MTTHQNDLTAGLGALALITRKRDGFGIPGPYGNLNQPIPAGTYEVSGTGVHFRDQPNGAVIGTFNPDMSRGDIVIGTPDQVEADGQVASAGGLYWAHITAQGKSGYVAVEYLAPVGWTAQQGKVAPNGGGQPVPNGGGGGGITNNVSTTEPTDYTPYILGGVALLGLGVIGYAAFKKKKKHHHA